MKRGPVLVCATAGLFFAAQYYVPHPAGREALSQASDAVMVAGSVALLLGASALVREHGRKVRETQEGWGYSAVTLAALAGAFSVGVFCHGRTEDAVTGLPTALGRMYAQVLSPLQATLFATLGFFLASAACRRLRFRGLEASLFAASALLLLASRIPAAVHWFPPLEKAGDWVMAGPALAGSRGLLMGIALGVLGAALRLIQGIDRPWEREKP